MDCGVKIPTIRAGTQYDVIIRSKPTHWCTSVVLQDAISYNEVLLISRAHAMPDGVVAVVTEHGALLLLIENVVGIFSQILRHVETFQFFVEVTAVGFVDACCVVNGMVYPLKFAVLGEIERP